jgi:hypothetical protein
VDELSFSTSLSSRSSYPLLRSSPFEQNQAPTCHHNHAAEDLAPNSGSAVRLGATMFAITVRAHHLGLDRSEAMWRALVGNGGGVRDGRGLDTEGIIEIVRV